MKELKIIIILFVVLIISSSIVSAHGEEIFAEAEEIIEAKISCDQLTDDQLEVIGDYYMEQMHPGEAHEQMDSMMGGEGSESLRLMHISMARSFYCGESNTMSSGMMDMMMGRGMMVQETGGFGMWPFGFLSAGLSFTMVLLLILLIGLVVWLLFRNNKK
jgi:hypothetical protein